MPNHLRLLIDEDVDIGVIRILKRRGRHNIQTVRDFDLEGKDDPAVFAVAQRDQRILVTADLAIDDSRHPICTHQGILRLAPPLNFGALASEPLRRFFNGGFASKLPHSVITLRPDSVEISGPEPGTPRVVARL